MMRMKGTNEKTGYYHTHPMTRFDGVPVNYDLDFSKWIRMRGVTFPFSSQTHFEPIGANFLIEPIIRNVSI